jgi:A/G-specific adenine glycosylase
MSRKKMKTSALLRWYHANKRDMPWRSDPTPYKVWISEMMLQQTRVETVIPYFERFIKRFPSIEVLADASIEDVLKLWEGLGYYSRARNLHKAAKIVADQFGGALPQTAAELQTLPGIGPYASAAVAGIAFGEAVPVVDGNVLRVVTRLHVIEDDISRNPTREHVRSLLLAPIQRSGDPSAFNQAIMELGAMICTPKHPNCAECPFCETCEAHKSNKVDQFPVKVKKPAIPKIDVVVAVISDLGNRSAVLVQQRNGSGMLPGLWEVPGGKIQPGETYATAAIRKVKEQLNLEIDVPGKVLTELKHTYSHFRVHITAVTATIRDGLPVAGKGIDQARWVTVDECAELAFGKAARQILDHVFGEE